MFKDNMAIITIRLTLGILNPSILNFQFCINDTGNPSVGVWNVAQCWSEIKVTHLTKTHTHLHAQTHTYIDLSKGIVCTFHSGLLLITRFKVHHMSSKPLLRPRVHPSCAYAYQVVLLHHLLLHHPGHFHSCPAIWSVVININIRVYWYTQHIVGINIKPLLMQL